MWIVGSLEALSLKARQDPGQNRSARTRAVVDSSLYTYLQAWVEGGSPMPHPGSDGVSALRGGACKYGQRMWQARPAKENPTAP